jgi:very-short-patch-repair endonuclease
VSNVVVARQVRRVLRRQNSAIHGRQLRAAGLTRSAIRARVARGALVAVFREVYVAGDLELLPLARESAALLSLGPASLLSHRSAAAVWGFAAKGSSIDVTVIDSHPRPRAGIAIHRVKTLHPGDTATEANLRITSPARTMIDFATEASGSELEEAFGEARAKHLINDAKLDQALRRSPANHPGAACIRHLLRSDPATTYTRSKAERLLRRLLKAAGLPEPRVNVSLLGYTADFLWPEHELILEVDGYGSHGHRLAFERDRRRDQVHIAAGYTVIRVTWEQLKSEPFGVIARIAQGLASRAA